jgi:RNA polymerase sigma factor (sigma-70 family)
MSTARVGSTATMIGALFAEGSAIGVTDEQLLERFLLRRDEGAEFAFGALVERHGPMVLSVCRNALRDQHDAEDAFQATFLVLARKASGLRVPGRLSPWLYGVARRTCQKVKTRRARLDRLKQQVEAKAQTALFYDTNQDTSHQEESEMLHEEIGRLPDRYRTPLVLCYFEGLTQEEAARRLGWPIGTVGVRLMRARERLRGRLTRRGLTPAMAALLPQASRVEPLTGSLAAQTARLAISFSSRTATASAAVPSHIAGAALGVLRSMAIKKVAGAVVAVFLCGLVTGGAVLAFQPPAGRSKAKAVPPPAASKAASEVDEPKSILTNGGIEKGDTKGSVPEGWQKGARLAGVEYQWDRSVAHQGKASLHLKKTAQRFFPIAQWSQEVKRSGAIPRLKLSAFIKAKKMTKAILDVQFIDRANELTHQWAAYIGAKESGDPPVTHDWKRYQGIVEIPDGTQKISVAVQVYGPGDVWVDDIVADYTEEKATDPLASIPPVVSPAPADSDVADIAFEERTAGNDPRKRYLLIGPSTAPNPPAKGQKLLLILPGGDGGTGFQTFVRRIAKNALPPGYLVAQLVAVSWTPEQAKQIVWPTATNRPAEVGFTTEEFVEAVIADVSRTKKIDSRYVFALGWSSGGPPVYASSLSLSTRVTGWFVAMSVFKPDQLPPLENAKKRAVYIYHSQEDDICPYFMAEQAAETLRASGATVQLTTYDGGHGWRGPVYDNIRAGIDWLEERQSVD